MNEPTELCFEVLIEARMHLLDRFLARGGGCNLGFFLPKMLAKNSDFLGLGSDLRSEAIPATLL
ncbi:MAG: hypothetical protein ACK5RP_15865 [Betaproteobacteria bacterium]